MKKMKIILLFAMTVIIFLYFQNNYIVTTKIKYSSEKVPQSFNGFVIVQISDLHGKVFVKDNTTLITKINKAKPDLIVITGDLIDCSFYDEKSIDSFIKRITAIAPTYFVTGNHEMANRDYLKLERVLKNSDVKILKNSTDILKHNGQYIRVTGINDPQDASLKKSSVNVKTITGELEIALGTGINHTFTILLTHRPEHFSLYSEFNIDLIFAGHAHGGQIRLPFMGGLLSPDQGFFPKYSSGKYTNGNSTMIVSRGLGNGSFSQRLFNQPEIVVTTLISE